MTFLNPLMLWGLLFLFVPVLVHLRRRPAAKPYPWAATAFLERSARDSHRPRKLQDLLLLLLRLLVLLFLFLALARPILPDVLGGGAPREHVVVVFDRSPGMDEVDDKGRSLLARSCDALKKELSSLEPSVQVSLIDSQSETLMPLESISALGLLEQTQRSALPCRIPPMLSKVFSEISLRQWQSVEVWIVSSDQRESWSPEHAAWSSLTRRAVDHLGNPVILRNKSLKGGDRETGDLALAVQELEAVREGNPAKVRITLSSEREMGGNVPLKWQRLGSPVQEVLRELTPSGKWYSEWIELNDPSAQGAGSGRLILPPDHDLKNNVRYYAYGPTQKVQTILVSNAPSSPATSAFTRACALPSRAEQKVSVVSLKEFLHLDLTEVALLVWLEGVGTPEHRERIEEYLREGGTALICPSSQLGAVAPLNWYFSGLDQSLEDRYFKVGEINEQEGPWRGSPSGDLPLERVRAVQRATLASSAGSVGGAESLVRWSDGLPLLTRKFAGKGILYLLATLPDNEWSNLEQTALHLIFVQRVLAKHLRQRGSGYLYEWTHSLLAQGPQKVSFDSSGTMNAANSNPGTQEGCQSGLYRLGGHIVAINAAPTHGERRISKAEIEDLLTSESTATPRSSTAAGPKRAGLSFFLLFALISLILEALLRTLRQRSSPPSPPLLD